MLVSDIMSSQVHSCTIDQSAGDAVELMELFDIGCVPIVDTRRSPIAMVTDRDIAIATHNCNLAPRSISIRNVMSKGLFSCNASDSVAAAERTMRDWQVRRLPVVDANGQLCGILSLNDIALATERSPFRLHGQLEHTLAAVCRHRARPVGVQF